MGRAPEPALPLVARNPLRTERATVRRFAFGGVPFAPLAAARVAHTCSRQAALRSQSKLGEARSLPSKLGTIRECGEAHLDDCWLGSTRECGGCRGRAPATK